MKTLFLNPNGSALTREVKRANHIIAKEKAKQGIKCIGKSGIITGITALACKALGMDPSGWALFSGAMMHSVFSLNNPKLNDAIKYSKTLQAQSEYKEIVARAKKIYNM